MSAPTTTARSARSRPVALLVHDASLPYVRPVVEFVFEQLAIHLGRAPCYAECSDVASTAMPDGSLVFLIGDGFPRYPRSPGCRYVFVNFSLVRRMRWWKPVSRSTARWIGAKHRSLVARRDQYDLVLDFHPRQARLLARDLEGTGVRVRSFMPGVATAVAQNLTRPLSSRRFDVCLVGTDSPRRARMRALLEHRGITVSPSTAACLDAVIRDSRVVANVHYEACDTLESPRVLHALAAGACLVTEPCYRLCDVAPTSCYVRVPYRHMPAAIARLLRDTPRIDAIGRAATYYMSTRYAPRATASWREIVDEALSL